MEKNIKINKEYKAKWNECYVFIDKVVHRLYCKITDVGVFELYLDDECILSKKYSIIKLKGFDYAVEIDGETIHCVFDEEKLDVAIHGRYLKSQKNYIPLKAVYIICIALCVLTPIMFVLANIGTMDVAVLVLGIGSVVSVGIYYKKAVKKLDLKESEL